MVASTSSVRLSTVLMRNVRRKRSSDVLDLGIDGGGHGAAVRADQHQRRSDDDFVALFTRAAGARLSADLDLCDIPDADRDACAS